jgi:Ser/Thr protein kinase RdoA (MazF antagonist)
LLFGLGTSLCPQPILAIVGFGCGLFQKGWRTVQSVIALDNSVTYLIGEGLVTAQDVIEGDLEITSTSRRNQNLRVTRNMGVGYLIKRPDRVDSEPARTIRREAAFYEFCKRHRSIAKMTQMLPDVLFHDPASSCLALELLSGAVAIWRFYQDGAAADALCETTASIGRALANLHRTFRVPRQFKDTELSFLPDDLPWALEIHRPRTSILSGLSQGSHKVIEILQTTEGLRVSLDEHASIWKPNTVIHGDVRLDNILVQDSSRSTATKEVRLVDWEMVQIGDPAWDIGGALQDFVFFWILSMPHEGDPEEMAAKARFPIGGMHPAIRALWNGYCGAAEITLADAESLLARAVRFAAVRLIQTSFEAASHFSAIPSPSVLTLQVAINILKDPTTSRGELFGITDGE